MTVLVMRHAHAGDRERWRGDDRRRPLSPHGRRQASLLVDALARWSVDRVLSSEYARCVDTVAPLAERLGVEVEHHPALLEDAPLEDVFALIGTLGAGATVLCSHGDLIGALIDDLRRRGVDVGAEPRWPKGSVWVLQRGADRPCATYLPPPA